MKSYAELILENPELPSIVRQKLLAGMAHARRRQRRKESLRRMARNFGPVYGQPPVQETEESSDETS